MSADRATPATETAHGSLRTASLVAVCVLALFGFSHEAVMQPVLPLVILDRGGDAALVGLLVAAYGIPTIVLRPFIGRALDTRSHATIMRAGASLIAVAPLGFLLPATWTTFVARLVQGTGWSAYGASGHALLAKIAPEGRRGEAAGYYNAMAALAVLLGPATGLWLYGHVGEWAPFLAGSGLGLAGLLLALRIRIPSGLPRPRPAGAEPRAVVAGVLERSSLVPMLITATFISVQSLFVVFAPVYARARGIPIGDLGLYYPVYGAVVLIGQLTLGRASDRFGRLSTIVLGCVMALVGLAIAGLGGDLATLALGGALYGVANALTTSALGATAIDGAPRDRVGAAMATYSLGYQLGASVGGAIWGVLIAAVGYPWPFFVGCAVQALCAVVAVATLGRAAQRGRLPI
jgi:MFS family permease